MALAESFLQALEEIVPVRRNEPIALHTTFRIGGPAEAYVRCNDGETLSRVVALAYESDAPLFIMGGGSNLLVSDKGMTGVVVETWTNANTTFPMIDGNDEVCFSTYSGTPLPRLATNAAKVGLSGLEWAIGIPGTVGGGVVNNAGAHGGSVSELIRSVRVCSKDGKQTISAQQLGFAYRASIFKHKSAGCAPSMVVLSAELALRPDDPAKIRERMAEHSEYRRSTQPSQRSIGSIFKNPPDNAAGRLLEQAGVKGHRVGDAQISTKHANFIVNRGNATAAEVTELMAYAQDKVRTAFGVELEPEIQRVGEGF